MKTRLILPLVLAAAAATGETYLRIEGGIEHRSELSTNGLPAEIATPLRQRMADAGWLPYVPAVRPPDTWCSTWVRTLAATNGAWHEGWVEASVPVPLDRAALVGTLLALPNGTNLLAVALASEPVAAWFAGEPTYIRGSQGARAIAAALGIDQAMLEALVAASLGLVEDRQEIGDISVEPDESILPPTDD